jgi:hypothetical protein
MSLDSVLVVPSNRLTRNDKKIVGTESTPQASPAPGSKGLNKFRLPDSRKLPCADIGIDREVENLECTHLHCA